MVSHIPEFNLIRLLIKAATKTFHITEIRECLYHDNTEPEFNWTQVPDGSLYRPVRDTDYRQADRYQLSIYIHRKHVHYSIKRMTKGHLTLYPT
jgi:hypothetical protein